MTAAGAALLLSAGLSPLAQADQAAEAQQVHSNLVKLLGQTPDSVEPSVVAGVYEVMLGPQIFYVSSDGKYLFTGKLFDIATQQDLTSSKLAHAKLKAIEDVGEENMVIFGPDDAKHTVTIFTDIDCGYCRKLHNEMDQYNERGIRVRYMMFPRAGEGSPSYLKAVSVWCADDRKEALTRSKAGQEVEQKTCDNPVKRHLALGSSLGISGTPAVFLPNGELLPGYVPAARMSAILEGKTK
jgi:thiol:disulfide interchange protein DsbC